MTNNRFAITLLLSTLLVACAGTDDQPSSPDAGGDPSAELAAARAACRSSCDAVAESTGCPTGAAAAQAAQCLSACENALAGLPTCARAGEAFWSCLSEQPWSCANGMTPAEPARGACTAVAETLRTCIFEAP